GDARGRRHAVGTAAQAPAGPAAKDVVTRDRDSHDDDEPEEAPLDPRTAELFDLARTTLGDLTPTRAHRGRMKLRARSSARWRPGAADAWGQSTIAGPTSRSMTDPRWSASSPNLGRGG